MATKNTSKTSSTSKGAAKSAASPVSAKTATASVKAKTPYQPTHEEIAFRAFEIYQQEGGDAYENWLRAERELIARGPK